MADQTTEAQNGEVEREVDDLLKDPSKRAAILRRLEPADFPHLTPSGTAGGGGFPTPFGTFPTPSGTFSTPNGACPHPMTWFPYAPFPTVPFPWINPQITSTQRPADGETAVQPTPARSTEINGMATPVLIVDPDAPDNDEGENEEVTDSETIIEPLDPEEAKEFQDFDPKLKNQETWQPPTSMTSFLEKYFNQCLEAEERQAILDDFPKPQCDVLQAPKLDQSVREQLWKRRKDPQFGAEKTLYKLQEQLLEVTGPLACLWSDLLNPDSNPTNEQIIQLLQRALVLVGSTSHAISVERRKIAWGRINPSLKALAKEDYDDRKDNLFGPGFLEKASKKLDTDKALAKVVGEGYNPRKRSFEEDPNDLRRFLSKGAPAQYGGKGKQRQTKPYNTKPYNNNSKKYPHHNRKQQGSNRKQ